MPAALREWLILISRASIKTGREMRITSPQPLERHTCEIEFFINKSKMMMMTIVTLYALNLKEPVG